MTNREASKLLREFNLWRRDVNVPNSHKMPNPTEIGIAIDKAILALESCMEE